ncbi:type III-A CRISPR-associated protein Csm2 [Anabaena aphanizomenioides LEGE 00250]|uniref:CRISPR system Cms protein Csm2 n=1 Tax=Sphaerospermopsis aphanizomenoides LEGE 00250 TaxID=2777972 RepID=A0ABR9VJV9_9CYAN|nr:type III-A CRISPR-associated protein Csm2 [Sphaerospermopsis aphanizomenoides]MBE9238781.1 type III-A CRISPR-associated protein Csm2 [Sphaerospermopsis aphanizomenoides LEGE 00250]
MNNPNRPQPPTRNSGQIVTQSNQTSQSNSRNNRENTTNIVQEIKDCIQQSNYLKDYPIRTLVTQANFLGYHLKEQKLETNQIRKFLDAINQIKYILALDDEKIKNAKTEEEQEKLRFNKIETEIVLLKPKLAYAAARQKAVKPLNEVMIVAIDRVKTTQDFYRLVQFIESIIAYHKEADSRR